MECWAPEMVLIKHEATSGPEPPFRKGGLSSTRKLREKPWGILDAWLITEGFDVREVTLLRPVNLQAAGAKERAMQGRGLERKGRILIAHVLKPALHTRCPSGGARSQTLLRPVKERAM